MTDGADRGHDDGGKADRRSVVRRNLAPFDIIDKIKLWPSKAGVLHGVRALRLQGGVIELTTHCGQTILVRNSRNSRVARHLRNKVCGEPCARCRIPAWKLQRFADTSFR
jgi:pyrrolysyl-tRNA synthetase-like protein